MALARTKPISLLVSGGVDTKTDPKLMQPPGLLEAENMYYLRTGELHPRNGFSRVLDSFSGITNGENLFPTPQGGLMTVNRSSTWPVPQKYSSVTAIQGWKGTGQSYPAFAMKTAGVVAASIDFSGAGQGQTDLLDPDTCQAGNFALYTFHTANVGGTAGFITESSSGKTSGSFPPDLSTGSRPPVACAGGSSFLVWFSIDTGAPPSIRVRVVSTATPLGFSSFVIAAGAVSAAQPWIDAKPIPGGNTIALAFRATTGGITCLIFDPSTGGTSSSVTTAAADATFCLGWLDDSLATGNMYLATAGSTAGVVVRTMSASTMVVSATNVIDATATAGVRNVTGHINTSSTNYVVLWDIAGSTSLLDRVNRGAWTGSASVQTQLYWHSLNSRSYKAFDGRYYFVGTYDSTTQPSLIIFPADIQGSISSAAGQLASGEGGGRRAVSSLTSAWTSGGTATIAISRRVKLTLGAVAQGRSIQSAAISYIPTTMSKPRELGGTLFMAGGILSRDDGNTTTPVIYPWYPEVPAVVSSATGSMTASGAYSYRQVFRTTDGAGKISRTAASVPIAITLGAGDGRVTITFSNPVNFFGQAVTVEHYRAGPAAAGSVNYNKVGESTILQVGIGDTSTFIDSMSDANANLGELLYSTGNVLENFVPPSAALLEVCSNRVWIVNAEDPTELWPSLEIKSRLGVRFNPLLAFKITGDGYGGMTALAAMDGRLIAFKSKAIYVISGNGPNDSGQGSFNSPQAISLTVGTILPRSLVETTDGIMFQSLNGIYLLDRSLSVSYIGSPVEQYTLAGNVVAASLVEGATQARFVFANGRCLVWDYFAKKWTTFVLRTDFAGAGSTIVDCANVPGDAWYYMLALGTVLKEIPGSTTDVSFTTTSFVPRVAFPVLQLAGLAGYQRFKAVELTLDVLGNHTVSVDAEYNYSGAVTGTPKTIALTTATPTVQVEYNPPEGKAKCTAVRIVLTVTGSPTTGTFRISGATAYILQKAGTNVIPANRLT